MEEKVLTADTEQMVSLLQTIRRSMRKADRLSESYKPLFNGERYVTDRELSERLHVSRRTLQDYRATGILPYIILGGKVLYREGDVQGLLERNYRTACGK